MIDGGKFYSICAPAVISNLENKFEFFESKVSIKTGDTSARRIKAKYRNFTITIAADKHVTIQGSLHKSFSNGVNYNPFPYSKMVQAIATLSEEIGIDARRLTIQNMEAGVNISDASFSFDDIERNLIAYKNKPFAEYRKGKSVFGKYAERQRYTLKIYNKGIQESLPVEIIRAELKFKKAFHLHSTGIYTLANLTDKNFLDNLGIALDKHFGNILMNDAAAMQHADMSFEDRINYLMGCNPNYWKTICNSATHHRRRFEKIIAAYGGSNLTEKLVASIRQHWQQLLDS